MTRKELYDKRSEWINKRKYVRCFWENYNYKILQNIMYIFRSGRGDNDSYNDCIIMADCETSKHTDNPEVQEYNYIVAFTITIRAFNHNIVTLWGRTPEEFIQCITNILDNLAGDKTVIYYHNLPYDYVFKRKFLFKTFGYPVKQLNVKPHYPIVIEFNNGLIFKDSLILSQCKLEKWADDLNVEHKKAVGKWDYNKIRSQHENYDNDELEYIEYDTLAGAECLQLFMDNLGKKIYSIPYTATGIPREQVYKLGKEHHAHDFFVKISPDYDFYCIQEQTFHGGYAHANRHLIDLILEFVRCFDFTSSYPFCILTRKFPMSAFEPWHDCHMDEILKNSENYAFIFKLILYKFKLKDPFESMPVLQFSKGQNMINCVQDNGRILCGGYMEIYITEQDLDIIKKQYEFEKHACVEVRYAVKDYLPKWFTDYTYTLFKNKCVLKGGDPVDYAIAKATLNSLFGMCVQKALTVDYVEDYETGEFTPKPQDDALLYQTKYIKNHRKVLPYSWGLYITAYALHNLYDLFECVDKVPGVPETYPIYADTDSCYAIAWNEDKIKAYNDRCLKELRANGYEPVVIGNKEFIPGQAVSEGDKDLYTEFKVQGAKRYCGRKKSDGKIHITVAGVPKKGAECLKDDINNFKKGFVFRGDITGKLQHKYIFQDDIFTDSKGNIVGDSIDLSSCDYLLDDITIYDFEKIFEEEIEVQTYE